MTHPTAYQPPLPPLAPPASPELHRSGRLALSLSLMATPLAIVAIGVPAALIGSVACGVTAVVLGIRTTRAASRAGAATVGTAVAGLTVGALSLFLAGLMTVALLIFWPQLSSLRDCLTGANTAVAQSNCEQTFIDDVSHR